MKSVVIIGDKSNHGNVVTSGATATKVGGIPIAYVGSAVSGDPHRHSPNHIVSPGTGGGVKVGTPGGDYYAVAAAGAGTACGASLNDAGHATKFK